MPDPAAQAMGHIGLAFAFGLGTFGLGAIAFAQWKLVIFATLAALGAIGVWVFARSLQGFAEFVLRRLWPEFDKAGWRVFVEQDKHSEAKRRPIWSELFHHLLWGAIVGLGVVLLATVMNVVVGMTWLRMDPMLLGVIAAVGIILTSGGLRLLLAAQRRVASSIISILEERGYLKWGRWAHSLW